jgi:hypothetical protein
MPNRQWFLSGVCIQMNDLILNYGIDCHGLLRAPKKKLSTAL